MKNTLKLLFAASIILGIFSCKGASTGTDCGPGLLLITIQPGQRYLPTLSLDPPNIAVCTLSWVYDGTGSLAGRVYVGTAAHCTFSVGEAIALLTTGEVFGDVAARGSLESYATDCALIEVHPAFYGRVSAAMLNHPQYPTGVTSPDLTAVGDIIQLNDLLLVPKQAQLTGPVIDLFVTSAHHF